MSPWSDKLRAFFGGKNELNAAFFDDLSDLLVEGDFGAALAAQTIDKLEKRCSKEKIRDPSGARELLAAMLTAYLAEGAGSAGEMLTAADNLNVTLLLGVNGVGKTTTAAKLAARFQREGKPLLAACDTFRAAAIEQLKIHGERLGVRVVAHQQHADAAAVLHDALKAAGQGGCTHVIADTAGRMHTKSALVDELAKISRVVENAALAGSRRCNYRKILVLDATTGSNALAQTEVFNDAVRIDGVILTKFDSTARGGVVFALGANFKLPVLFICDGEGYGDIHPFDAAAFARDFLC